MVYGKFKEECISGLGELFQAISRTKGGATIQSCLHHLVDLPDVKANGTTLPKLEFYLLPECLHNPTNLSAYITHLESRDACRVPHVITMLKLYGYVQCIEVRYVYKVVGNLLGQIGGGSTSGDLYENSFSASNCFEDIRKRHKRLTSSSGQVFPTVDLWSRFLDFDLRNAVGHSDFIIRNESRTILIPSYAVKEVLRSKKSKARKSAYKFSEIDTLYSMASDFHEAFKQVIQDHGVRLGPRY